MRCIPAALRKNTSSVTGCFPIGKTPRDASRLVRLSSPSGKAEMRSGASPCPKRKPPHGGFLPYTLHFFTLPFFYTPRGHGKADEESAVMPADRAELRRCFGRLYMSAVQAHPGAFRICDEQLAALDELRKPCEPLAVQLFNRRDVAEVGGNLEKAFALRRFGKRRGQPAAWGKSGKERPF